MGDVLARLIDKAADFVAPQGTPGDGWRQLIKTHYTGGKWPDDKLGPPPGAKNCKVPPEIVRELGLNQKAMMGPSS
jgi:hypothetical protein